MHQPVGRCVGLRVQPSAVVRCTTRPVGLSRTRVRDLATRPPCALPASAPRSSHPLSLQDRVQPADVPPGLKLPDLPAGGSNTLLHLPVVAGLLQPADVPPGLEIPAPPGSGREGRGVAQDSEATRSARRQEEEWQHQQQEHEREVQAGRGVACGARGDALPAPEAMVDWMLSVGELCC